MDLFEDDGPGDPGGNAPPLSVSEVSGAIKRVIEGEFARVRVRGEVGRVSRPSSGHLYFDLKDDRAVLASVCWRDNAARLVHRPEEGMEVIVTGRLTTFPGQSRYQMLVETVEPAGVGALMAMLDQRRRTLQAEGLFDPGRKRPIPFLPGVIAVVTSPSGAVIRDILHRLRERFPSRVLIWPVAVQGAQSAAQVADAIRRLNALEAGGRVPLPDLIIVARGGGSIEDLWGFNDEALVRAVAAGTIPLISAVGHETDTTLIDHAADLRAPTPTAAAEMAVPVLAELGGRIADNQGRLWRSIHARIDRPAQRLSDLGRALGRPQALTEPARQRLDLTAPRLEQVLRLFMRERRQRADALDLPIYALRIFMSDRRGQLVRVSQALDTAALRAGERQRNRMPTVPIAAVQAAKVAARQRLGLHGARLVPSISRDLAARRRQLALLGGRLDAARRGTALRGQRRVRDESAALTAATARLSAQAARILSDRRDRLAAMERLRVSLGHSETLRRGFVIVRDERGLVTSAAEAECRARLELEFHDGRLWAAPQSAASIASTDAPDVPDATRQVRENPRPDPTSPTPEADQEGLDKSHGTIRKAKPRPPEGSQGSLF